MSRTNPKRRTETTHLHTFPNHVFASVYVPQQKTDDDEGTDANNHNGNGNDVDIGKNFTSIKNANNCTIPTTLVWSRSSSNNSTTSIAQHHSNRMIGASYIVYARQGTPARDVSNRGGLRVGLTVVVRAPFGGGPQNPIPSYDPGRYLLEFSRSFRSYRHLLSTGRSTQLVSRNTIGDGSHYW